MFDGKVHRPTSAPSIQRIISDMSNEEPLFGKTYRKVALQNMNPNQVKGVFLGISCLPLMITVTLISSI